MIDILFPPARLVQGSLELQNETDNNKKPKLNPDGTQSQSVFFSVAIPKGAETDWKQTAWGAQMYQAAQDGFASNPAMLQRADFAFKVIDGDSPAINQLGKAWNTIEGFPGNWVIKMSTKFAPTVVGSAPACQPIDPKMVERGYWVEVYARVLANGDTQKPGIYVNPNAVSLVGYGEKITSGPDVQSIGFGQAPTPAGVTAAPVTGNTIAPAPQPQMQAPAPQPQMQAPAPQPQMQAPAPQPQMQAPAPNPAILQVPGAPAAPAPQKVLNASAGGATYDQMIAAGWTDELLIQHDT